MGWLLVAFVAVMVVGVLASVAVYAAVALAAYGLLRVVVWAWRQPR